MIFTIEKYRCCCKTIIHFLDKTPRVAMAGPFLMGERVRGMNPFDPVYETFLEINKEMAKRLNVTYFPFRDIFLSALPPGQDLTVVALRVGGPGGYLTIDGEHLNDRARDMVLEKFMQQLRMLFVPGGRRRGVVEQGRGSQQATRCARLLQPQSISTPLSHEP